MFRRISVLAGLAALVIAAPAASSVTISFGGNSATHGADGNVGNYSSGGVQVQASAWTLNGFFMESSFLGQYSNGLGVTNDAEGTGSLTSANAIDNADGYDSILLVFNQPVTLLSAVLTPYQVKDGPADNDATIAYANLAASFTLPSQTAVAIPAALWGNLASTAYSVAGSNNSPFATPINAGGASANVWFVSADILGLDHSADGFRLSSITVNTPAVPETSTWIMAILGFWGIGVAMKRSGRRAARFAQIA